MTGQLTINDKDAFDTWGATMIGDSIDKLLLPANPKPYVENKFRNQNGKQVLITASVCDERDIDIEFLIKADSKIEFLQKYLGLVAELIKGVIVLDVPYLGIEYKLTLDSYIGLGFHETFGKLSVRFNEPFNL